MILRSEYTRETEEPSFDFDGTYSVWGHVIEKQWGSERLPSGGFKVQGAFTPLPVVGKTVRLADRIYKFTKVEPMGNPRDGFFGEIEPL